MQLSGRAARQALNAHIGCLVECTVNDGGAPEPLAYIKMCLSPKDAGRAHQLKFWLRLGKGPCTLQPHPSNTRSKTGTEHMSSGPLFNNAVLRAGAAENAAAAQPKVA